MHQSAVQTQIWCPRETRLYELPAVNRMRETAVCTRDARGETKERLRAAAARPHGLAPAGDVLRMSASSFVRVPNPLHTVRAYLHGAEPPAGLAGAPQCHWAGSACARHSRGGSEPNSPATCALTWMRRANVNVVPERPTPLIILHTLRSCDAMEHESHGRTAQRDRPMELH